MTVNKNYRLIVFLPVLLFLATSGYATKKNILYVHFDTARVKAGTVFEKVLNVRYRIQASRPYTFTSFRLLLNYDETHIAPEGGNSAVFFDGTASGLAAFAHSNIDYTNHVLYIEVDNSPQSLDTTNPILCQIWWKGSVGVNDSAMVTPKIPFDISSDPGIDTVIIDNSGGRDQVSWYPFGLVFGLDTPKKVTIAISDDSLVMPKDSVIMIEASKLDSANIKSGAFRFDIDTSIFDTAIVEKGTLLGAANFSVFHTGSHDSVTFSQPAVITGQGELLKITLRARKRSDTVCTALLAPKFIAVNSDALLASVMYQLHGFCVLGRKDTTATKGIVAIGDEEAVAIYPNPANEYADILIPEERGEVRIEIFDALGRKIFGSVSGTGLRWETGNVRAGCYTLSLESKGGKRIETRKIAVIH